MPPLRRGPWPWRPTQVRCRGWPSAFASFVEQQLHDVDAESKGRWEGHVLEPGARRIGRVDGEGLPGLSRATSRATGASRLKSRASRRVTVRLSMSASRVASWQLTPGTSSIHPIHHSPSCLMTAVNLLFVPLPPSRPSVPLGFSRPHVYIGAEAPPAKASAGVALLTPARQQRVGRAERQPADVMRRFAAQRNGTRTILISRLQPTASAYFCKVAIEGECF